MGLKSWVELTLPQPGPSRRGEGEGGRLNSAQVFSPHEKITNLEARVFFLHYWSLVSFGEIEGGSNPSLVNGHIHRLIIPRWAKRVLFVQIEPLAALFWALGIVLISRAYTSTGNPARQPGIPQLRYSTAVESWVELDRRSVATLPFPL